MIFRQYLCAAAVGIVLLLLQTWQIAENFGLNGGGVKNNVMQLQIAAQIASDPSTVAAIVGFVLFALMSHLLLALGAVAVYRGGCRAIAPARLDSLAMCLGFLALVMVSAILANQWLFPMSDAFSFMDLVLVQAFSPALIVLLVLLCGGMALASVITFVRENRRLSSFLLPVLAIATSGTLLWQFLPVVKAGASARSEPDIIILGIDSLRPDFVPAYGQFPARLTPAIDRALEQAVILRDVKTPVARTFVSYSSILTGKNPVNSGIRFNLHPRSEFSRGNTVAWSLKERGYQTLFAMDESRFANFDDSFGFDVVVGPTAGALDFVVGGSFDLFATNLILSILPATDALSPVKGNRAAYRNYRLNDHPRRLSSQLRELSSEKPLFMVGHLCLPHWPYLPSDVHGDDLPGWIQGVEGYADAPAQYLRALQGVDRQFQTIWNELEAQGRLANAVVIVLSDHGEDFAMERDRLAATDPSQSDFKFFGHGNFALSKAQNHVVMAIQRYRDGRPVWRARMMEGAASTIDVAPTLLDLLDAKVDHFEGESWRQALDQGGHLRRDRIRFFENGIRSAGVEQAQIDEKAVAGEMSYLYRITSDMRFEVRPELLPVKLAEKQRGATRGSVGVMTDPVTGIDDQAMEPCWQVVDYAAGTMGCTGYPSTVPGISELQDAVCQHFRGDMGFEAAWCHRPMTDAKSGRIVSEG
ncbi:sulfatase-like hydrolase/transferase [Stenotrophomonas maltophilia]|uniref:sulfatase-like hydrolase/transferase n=1 Tax=Stenotrophomonas maltophilia TaxID=40324 RepID=UPI0022F3E4D3|nr:sulfatase-like hydrolase/transferase [Stenotrophomonas maltophilia]MDA5342636.1 sulfatase-like hydrolase/transferase [Stenotrophomonas maltophilia]